MEKYEATDKQKWNDFVRQYGPRSGAFLYSWEWSELASGQRYEFYEEGEMVGITSTGRILLPLGQAYLSCICGPIATTVKNISKILELLSDHTLIFIRFEPAEEIKDWRVKKTRAITPATTLITSLSPEPKILLEKMHPKTRYNINLAQRKGVRIKRLAPPEIKKVWPLFLETAKRDGFRIHPQAHYNDLLNLKSDEIEVFLVAAFFEDKPLAVNIMVDFNGTRTYLHGASSNKNRNLMAPYLLHWELMKEAQEKGLRFYDWWGVAQDDNPKNSWAGITRFKKGFGGEIVSYPGTFDYVLRPIKYFIYKAFRSLRRLIR